MEASADQNVVGEVAKVRVTAWYSRSRLIPTAEEPAACAAVFPLRSGYTEIMDTADLDGITGDISILVAELSRNGCSVSIVEWTDDGLARLEATLPGNQQAAQRCMRMIEERRGPITI